MEFISVTLDRPSVQQWNLVEGICNNLKHLVRADS